MARIFISYRRADSSSLATLIAVSLKQHGIEAFVDTRSIDGGGPFPDRLRHAIEDCDVFVCLLGETTLGSAWVLEEIEHAHNLRKTLIPIFQERYSAPSPVPNSHVEALLQSDGVHVLDVRNLYVDEAIAQLATMIRNSMPAPTPTMPRQRMIPTWLWGGIGLLLLVALVALVVLPRIGSAPATTTPTNVVAGVPSETPFVQPTLTDTPTPSNTPTADMGATEGAQLQATLTQLAAQAQDVRLTATADGISRLATSQVEGTLGAAAGAVTAVAIEITQAALAETATQQAIFATETRQAADMMGTQAARDATATAESWTDTPTPTGFTLIARNGDWTPIEQDFDGVTMVLVPVGCFDMGSTDGEVEEQPVHEQCFDAPFWIDRFEVTNAQYGSSGRFSGDNRPRESVTRFKARDFCAGRGARLPTEREWEYAARGPDNLQYPWGNDFVADNVVYSGNSNGQTAAVGSRPAGASWVGAFDLSGNVWEWVSSIYQPYPYKADDGREVNSESTDVRRGLRGGSWGNNDYVLRAAYRHWNDPTYDFGYIGFRCVLSYN